MAKSTIVNKLTNALEGVPAETTLRSPSSSPQPIASAEVAQKAAIEQGLGQLRRPAPVRPPPPIASAAVAQKAVADIAVAGAASTSSAAGSTTSQNTSLSKLAKRQVQSELKHEASADRSDAAPTGGAAQSTLAQRVDKLETRLQSSDALNRIKSHEN